MTAESVLEWTRPDGTLRVIIERVRGEFFQFRDERWVSEEEFGARYEYWSGGTYGTSGLYPSIVDAQNDAASAFPWLGDLLEEVASGNRSA